MGIPITEKTTACEYSKGNKSLGVKAGLLSQFWPRRWIELGELGAFKLSNKETILTKEA